MNGNSFVNKKLIILNLVTIGLISVANFAWAAEDAKEIIMSSQARLSGIPAYTVEVSSQFTGTINTHDPSLDARTKKQALVKQVKEINDKYKLIYAPGRKMQVQSILMDNKKDEQLDETADNRIPVRISFDENSFYEQVLSQYIFTAVEQEEINGHLCKRIHAETPNGRFQVTLWINESQRYLQKYSLKIDDKSLTDVLCIYRLEKNRYWLPHTVKISHQKQSGTTVLSYGSYVFNEEEGNKR